MEGKGRLRMRRMGSFGEGFGGGFWGTWVV